MSEGDRTREFVEELLKLTRAQELKWEKSLGWVCANTPEREFSLRPYYDHNCVLEGAQLTVYEIRPRGWFRRRFVARVDSDDVPGVLSLYKIAEGQASRRRKEEKLSKRFRESDSALEALK